ncbi:hypothetical protein A1D23_02430 [Chelonobacter oris]|uniref:uroporphyrinogen-III C-methyltransferase n=1 Tax=Chelonobacter oris TaxID=505317 RepID=UPI002447335F|nr:uroporphyrinogen-III C-methyltransferase [Chelonobacter oris]MDH3001260.1 hypothetical protein [Chelonobacter oris]
MSEKKTPDSGADTENRSTDRSTEQKNTAISLSKIGEKNTRAPHADGKKPKPDTDTTTDTLKTTEKSDSARPQDKVIDDASAKTSTTTIKENTMAKSHTNEATAPAPHPQSGGSKGLSLLAILIALGIGAGGYFWGQQQFSAMQQQVTALSDDMANLQTQPTAPSGSSQAQTQTNSEVSTQIRELQTKQDNALQQTQNEIRQLTAALDLQKTENSELRNQLNKLSFNNKSDPNDWLMSEADFLLTNAQRKLVLDNDIDTVMSLLQEANQTLQQVSSSQALSIRTAISSDLTQLQNVNDVDQDLIMSQLSLLISQVDNLKVLALNPNNAPADIGVSNSIDDWQSNLEKSASSFLDHFIRVQRKDPNRPELLAPNQDIFLKENIRLSLQVALSAVPRQQNEVYKQSLNSVASWIRSYFDDDDYSVQQFLQQIDQLKEQSIYVNAPQQLTAWQAIGTLLNREHRTLEQFSASEAAKKTAAENVSDKKPMSQTEDADKADNDNTPEVQATETKNTASEATAPQNSETAPPETPAAEHRDNPVAPAAESAQ